MCTMARLKCSHWSVGGSPLATSTSAGVIFLFEYPTLYFIFLSQRNFMRISLACDVCGSLVEPSLSAGPRLMLGHVPCAGI